MIHTPREFDSRRSGVARRALWSALLAAALLALPSIAAGGQWPHERNGWNLGIGIGGGSAVLSAEGESFDRQGGVAGNFRVGYNPRSEVGLGLESNGWTKEKDGARRAFSVTAAAVTFFPGSEGFYVRGGIGVGSLKPETEIGSTTFSGTETGLGLIGAAGYEFRLTRRMALAPGVDFGYAKQDQFSANYFNGTLQLNWYFIPQ